MTSTVTEIAPLTAEDIKALRAAETVVFRHRNRVTTLEVMLRDTYGDEPRIYSASEQRLFPRTRDGGANERERVLTVSGAVTWYEDDSRHMGTGDSAAFTMIHTSQYDEVWKTIASLLKPGDEVYLAFVGDRYGNGYSQKAMLHVDGLKMEVRRAGRVLTFNVDTSVCAANSARMVKPYGG